MKITNTRDGLKFVGKYDIITSRNSYTLSELSIPCGTFEWDIQDEDVTVTLLLSEGGDGK